MSPPRLGPYRPRWWGADGRFTCLRRHEFVCVNVCVCPTGCHSRRVDSLDLFSTRPECCNGRTPGHGQGLGPDTRTSVFRRVGIMFRRSVESGARFVPCVRRDWSCNGSFPDGVDEALRRACFDVIRVWVPPFRGVGRFHRRTKGARYNVFR